jgi:hypothetical protein
MDNLDYKIIPQMMNQFPPLFAYQLSYLQEYIKTQNIEFDYIVRYRNDLKVDLYDIKLYFNTKTYITPAYWRNELYLQQLSDHFFIMPFSKFVSLPLSIDTINKITPDCWDNEEVNNKLINPDIVIHPREIRAYKVRDRVFQ